MFVVTNQRCRLGPSSLFSRKVSAIPLAAYGPILDNRGSIHCAYLMRDRPMSRVENDWMSRTTGLITLIGLPAQKAVIWSKISENWISYSSRVTYPIWGVQITLSIAKSG